MLTTCRGTTAYSGYLRVYAGPGGGFRAGAGDVGLYAGGRLTVALLSDRRITKGSGSPYVEFEGRVPFASPSHRDVRIAFGMMLTLCKHCGWD